MSRVGGTREEVARVNMSSTEAEGRVAEPLGKCRDLLGSGAQLQDAY